MSQYGVRQVPLGVAADYIGDEVRDINILGKMCHVAKHVHGYCNGEMVGCLVDYRTCCSKGVAF